jgi:hypothetical protein
LDKLERSRSGALFLGKQERGLRDFDLLDRLNQSAGAHRNRCAVLDEAAFALRAARNHFTERATFHTFGSG